jgi:hypothetical protein
MHVSPYRCVHTSEWLREFGREHADFQFFRSEPECQGEIKRIAHPGRGRSDGKAGWSAFAAATAHRRDTRGRSDYPEGGPVEEAARTHGREAAAVGAIGVRGRDSLFIAC